MAVVCNGWCSVGASALAVVRQLRGFISVRHLRYCIIGTVTAALLWSTSQPAASAEKIIADYGGTSGFQAPLWAAREGFTHKFR